VALARRGARVPERTRTLLFVGLRACLLELAAIMSLHGFFGRRIARDDL
jgi:hypothetical protein